MRVTLSFATLLFTATVMGEPFRVVIDPGHGGESPGALGVYGVFEKDVTLAISKRLGRLLREEPGIEVFYTREDDITVGLEERAAVANAVDADVFISIHTNASPSPDVFGIETFFIGKGSDREADDTARRENDTETYLENHTVEAILHDLRHLASVQGSAMLAELVQDHLCASVPETNNRLVRQARFAVLKSAEMPAVVVELGFLTHPEEGFLLLQPAYQERLASAIRDAILKYRTMSSLSSFERGMKGHSRER